MQYDRKLVEDEERGKLIKKQELKHKIKEDLESQILEKKQISLLQQKISDDFAKLAHKQMQRDILKETS